MGAANLLLICIFRKMGGLQLDVAALSAGRPQHMDAVGRRGRAGLRCVRERERERQRERERETERWAACGASPPLRAAGVGVRVAGLRCVALRCVWRVGVRVAVLRWRVG